MQEAKGHGRSWKKSVCFGLTSSGRLGRGRVPLARLEVMRAFHTERIQREPEEQIQGGRESQRPREMEESQRQGRVPISFAKKR